MRLWIGVHLPLLALEVFRPRWCEPGAHAVLAQERVLVMSELAADMGVRSGLRRSGVQMIAPGAVLHEREPQREQQALDAVAMCLLQYTPEVALAGAAQLLLDVTASLRAFGGRLALCRRIRRSLRELGLSANVSMAPTAQGALLLACAAPLSVAGQKLARDALRILRVIRLQRLTRLLDALPLTALPAAHAHIEWLEGIGCRTLADVRRLPRAGLQRRASKVLLEEMDRAYGLAPELFEWVVAPPVFSVRMDLPQRTEFADAILFPARRLVLQMVGWLVAQQLAVSRFVLLMEHERGRTAVPPTALEIVLAEAAWDQEHLLRLLKERLGRLPLCAPVIGLQLDAMQLSQMTVSSGTLFAEPGGTAADYNRLLELLSARLGEAAVMMPAPVADYRPEISNQWQAAKGDIKRRRQPSPAAGNMAAGKTDVSHHPGASIGAGIGAGIVNMPAHGGRPFWLLEKPLPLLLRDHRPFYGSPLRLVSGPERIECGWWDESCAVRDYFIATGSDAACYWVYRQRDGDELRWFLHGLFA